MAAVIFDTVDLAADICLLTLSFICFSVSGAFAAGLVDDRADFGFDATAVVVFGFVDVVVLVNMAVAGFVLVVV